MAKNWAVSVGVNNYSNLQSLKYAKQDANRIRDFLINRAGFDQVFLFTEDSPVIPASPISIPTTPTYGHLRRFLRAQFEEPLLEAGDNLWFFFAGHGIRSADRDYLMLSDTDPGDVEHTGLALNFVIERLRRSGADNVILLLDACRNEGARDGSGVGIEQQQGVVSIFSCSPNERSYEIEELQQGSFTYSLLEGLSLQGEGNCATVERLYYHLRYRVSEINARYDMPRQTPYAQTEPATKLHLILLPKQATLRDLEVVKKDALTAESTSVEAKSQLKVQDAKQSLDLAEQLWIRVLAVAPGDIEAIRGLQRVERFRATFPQVHMESEVGVDYSFLYNLLISKQWQKADQMTAVAMMEISRRKEQGFLRPEDFKAFPRLDLLTIDRLWTHFSEGRFGFSAQQKIWQEIGGKPGANTEIFQEFSERIGWVSVQKDQDSESSIYVKKWKRWGELNFGLTAPTGHLPSPPRWWEKWDTFREGEDTIYYCL
ncbi:MAG: GUN4 domain-containing protein [Cyanobacteria bacterium J06621_3]